jgi:hypothetical protein
MTPRDDLRDRIANVRVDQGDPAGADRLGRRAAEAIMNSIPGLVDASNAREGWLNECSGYAELWPLAVHAYRTQRVLVIPAEAAS